MLNPEALEPLYEAGKQIDNIMTRMRQPGFNRFDQVPDSLRDALINLHEAVKLAERRKYEGNRTKGYTTRKVQEEASSD